jgi:hypothetical protein
MPESNVSSIADRPSRADAARLARAVFVAAVGVAGVAAWRVAAAGLTLSHYDARAHLVVARRIADSLTPGWRQLGAVWLPLPHLLNLIPVQWDWAYRTGAVAVALSGIVLAAGLAILSQRIYVRTRSIAVAIATPALVLLNPNLLYLAATPMTEPILIGFALAGLAACDAWIDIPTDASRRRAAWIVAGLVVTRYEGWLIAAGLLFVSIVGGRRRPRRELLALIAPSAGAIVIFLLLSMASTGRWLPSTDFFVADGEALHRPWTALRLIWSGMLALSSVPLAAAGVAGAVVCVARARWRLAALLPLSLALASALPFLAFTAGHPFRIRYMVPLVAASAVLAGVALSAIPRRGRAWASAALVGIAVWCAPPFSLKAPMPIEAQWETPFRLERQRVSAVLRERYDGTPILASMGSLAHYMQESSAIGLRLANFLHEGNGDLWSEALRSPKRSVRWVLLEERAEGGDQLAALARKDPEFLSGFARIADGGGLALYERLEGRAYFP